MLGKIDELETIMLGQEKGDPKVKWLKDKFDSLRSDASHAQQNVQRTAFGLGFVMGAGLAIMAAQILFCIQFGCR